MKDLGKIRERYDYSFDARQLGLVIFGVAAVAALIFVLGVSVGIQWQRKRQPEPLPQANARLGRLQVKAMPAAPPVLKPVTTSRTAFSRTSTASDKNQRTVTLTFPKVLASPSQNSHAPLVEKKVNQRPQGRYTVQIGAYKDASAARVEVKKLKKRGYDARVYAASGRRGGYNYKVHVGNFGTKGDAALEARRLSKLGVRPYITKE
ncbi:MAG: SPOR domain-containing protein [Nitrospirota bacterium]